MHIEIEADSGIYKKDFDLNLSPNTQGAILPDQNKRYNMNLRDFGIMPVPAGQNFRNSYIKKMLKNGQKYFAVVAKNDQNWIEKQNQLLDIDAGLIIFGIGETTGHEIYRVLPDTTEMYEIK